MNSLQLLYLFEHLLIQVNILLIITLITLVLVWAHVQDQDPVEHFSEYFYFLHSGLVLLSVSFIYEFCLNQIIKKSKNSEWVEMY